MLWDHSHPDWHRGELSSPFLNLHPQSRLFKRDVPSLGRHWGGTGTTYINGFLARSLESFLLCLISLTIQPLD